MTDPAPEGLSPWGRGRRPVDYDLATTRPVFTPCIAGLLAGLGLNATDERDPLDEAVQRLLTQRGLTGTVQSFRYGVLTIAAAPQDVALLRPDVDTLLGELHGVVSDPIDRIQLRVTRPGR